MTSYDNKKRFIINLLYIISVLAVFYFFMKYAFGVFIPFAGAFIVAALLQRPVNFLCSHMKIKRGLISSLLAVFLTLSVTAAIVFLAVKFGTKAMDFIQHLLSELQDFSQSLDKLQFFISSHLNFLPDNLQSLLSENLSTKVGALFGNERAQEILRGESSLNISSLLAGPLSGLWTTAKKLPSTLIAYIVFIVSTCFLTSDYKNITKLFLSLFKSSTADKIIKSKRLVLPQLGKVFKAYCIIFLITFAEICGGLSILALLKYYEFTYIPVVAFLTALIDIIPVFGTGTVLLPWAVYNLAVGERSFAIGLIILYVIITIIRQIIEPKLVAKQIDVPPFVVIFSMYLGSQFFGFLGIFLMPITVMIIKLLNDNNIINILHSHSGSDIEIIEYPEINISHKSQTEKTELVSLKVLKETGMSPKTQQELILEDLEKGGSNTWDL